MLRHGAVIQQCTNNNAFVFEHTMELCTVQAASMHLLSADTASMHTVCFQDSLVMWSSILQKALRSDLFCGLSASGS